MWRVYSADRADEARDTAPTPAVLRRSIVGSLSLKLGDIAFVNKCANRGDGCLHPMHSLCFERHAARLLQRE
jgi:hypothetical protein